MAQERVNKLHGEQAFRVSVWNGSKNPCQIKFGKTNPVEITVNRGEYLYRSDKKELIKGAIFNSVQKHLDEQGKNMTLLNLSYEYEPAIALCHCCGESLRFSIASKITAKQNTCLLCREHNNVKKEALILESAIKGITTGDRKEELDDLLFELQEHLDDKKFLMDIHQRKIDTFQRDYALKDYSLNKSSEHDYYRELKKMTIDIYGRNSTKGGCGDDKLTSSFFC